MSGDGIERRVLIDACLESIRQLADHHNDPPVVLKVRPGRMPKGWPRGELLNWRDGDETGHTKTMAFPALKVLRWALQEMALPQKEASRDE